MFSSGLSTILPNGKISKHKRQKLHHGRMVKGRKNDLLEAALRPCEEVQIINEMSVGHIQARYFMYSSGQDNLIGSMYGSQMLRNSCDIKFCAMVKVGKRFANYGALKNLGRPRDSN